MSKPPAASHLHADSWPSAESITTWSDASPARQSLNRVPGLTSLNDDLPNLMATRWTRLAPHAEEPGFEEFEALLLGMRRWEHAGVLDPAESAFVLEEATRAPESRRLLFQLCKHAAPGSEAARISSHFLVHAAALQLAALRQRLPWRTALRIAVAEMLQHTLTCAVLASGLARAAIARAKGSGPSPSQATDHATSQTQEFAQPHETLLMLHFQLGAQLGFPTRLRQPPTGVVPASEMQLAEIMQDLLAIRADPDAIAVALPGRPAWRVLLQGALARTPLHTSWATAALSPQRRELLFRLATLHMLKDATLTS